MSLKRPGVAKSTARAASGGAIVVVALLAMLFFRGVGSGNGEADSKAPASPDSSLVSTAPVAPVGVPVAPSETDSDSTSTGGLTNDEQKALSDRILAVLIDERSYLMEVPTDSGPIYRPAELDRLVELARQAEGDSNGIRVRILQRETARPSAEQDLRDRLAAIGITADAVYLSADFVQ
ncbi:MAG: hypothetical protein R3C59_18730 [Planctomycetaceae bacterium]